MRRTTGALSAAYGDNEEQEDDALDLVEEFEKLAETGRHVTGAPEASVTLSDQDGVEEDEDEIDDAALSGATGCALPCAQAPTVSSRMPEVPCGNAEDGLPADRRNQMAPGQRSVYCGCEM